MEVQSQGREEEKQSELLCVVRVVLGASIGGGTSVLICRLNVELNPS